MELTIIQIITIWTIPLLFAITLHEVAHGWVASWFGDSTAKLLGRLSINPIKHIDPIGTVLVPILMLLFSNFIFGWAKPVPVDPRNLHNPRRDMALVALAGPLSNLLMAFFWGLIAKMGMVVIEAGNTWLGIPLSQMGMAGIMINVVLAVLNILPIPPLDGGKIFASLLPSRMAYQLSVIEPYSFFILIFLIMSGILNKVMGPIVFLLANIIKIVFQLV
jgi:Zn-dependent protease